MLMLVEAVEAEEEYSFEGLAATLMLVWVCGADNADGFDACGDDGKDEHHDDCSDDD